MFEIAMSTSHPSAGSRFYQNKRDCISRQVRTADLNKPHRKRRAGKDDTQLCERGNEYRSRQQSDASRKMLSRHRFPSLDCRIGMPSFVIVRQPDLVPQGKRS